MVVAAWPVAIRPGSVSMAPTVYRTPKWRAIVVIAVATGFVVYGILAAIVSPNVVSVLFGAVCVILFGYVAVLLTVQLARRRPELTLTEEGLTFRNWTLVEWSRIRHIAYRRRLEARDTLAPRTGPPVVSAGV